METTQAADDKVQAECAHCGALNRFPYARRNDDPTCGKCKHKVFPRAPVVGTDASWRAVVEGMVKVNVDENPRIASLHGIRSIPALKLFRGPLELDQQVGALSKEAIDLWLERYL